MARRRPLRLLRGVRFEGAHASPSANRATTVVHTPLRRSSVAARRPSEASRAPPGTPARSRHARRMRRSPGSHEASALIVRAAFAGLSTKWKRPYPIARGSAILGTATSADQRGRAPGEATVPPGEVEEGNTDV